MERVPRVLTIAGSDSGGGAGIQADLKAFARCGVYGMTAVTAVTAQSTRAVTAVHHVPARVVRAQIEEVVADIGVDAVKVGMLGRAATARAVAAALRGALRAGTPLVVDPVIVASSGAELLDRDGVEVLIGSLLPLAAVLTPNLPEARLLLERAGSELPAGADDEALARALLALGPKAVVVTGGHRTQPADIYCDAEQTVEIEWARSDSSATHGSGCTHSAILAAQLARGETPLGAARTAARLTSRAVDRGHQQLGQGPGPVNITPPGEQA
jgi:hydroxymethylpyrimidine/phosphomethylpyrimidine kinase